MQKILENLNEKQLEAVKHYEGPMLVIAGAGSGKTKVLTHRIAYLIEEKQVSPYNIVAITFTNKAAKEMKERVVNLVGDVGKKMNISTFHSMCVNILRQNIDLLGYRDNFVIYDDSDTLIAIKNIMKDLNIDQKRYSPRNIKSTISNAKNDYLFPDDFKRSFVGTVKANDYTEVVSKIYQKYQEDLMKANALDFDDLIMLTIKLFERFTDVLNFYQRKFQFVLVDEYQDTNKTQFKLVKMISAVHHNIFVVGDTDQSIYSWRGADIRNIIEFEKDFFSGNDKVKVVYLEQNYRSYQNILDAANCVIKNNYEENNYVKKLWSNKKDDKPHIVYYRAINSDVEVDFIAQKIIEKCKYENYTLNDFAILYRTNAMSLNLEKAFQKYKIDYLVYGNVGFFERKEIKDLIAYLRLIINEADDLAFLRIINEPRRGIGETTVEQLKNYANAYNLTLFAAATKVDSLSAGAKRNLAQFVEMINKLKNSLIDIDLNDFIDLVLEETTYLTYLQLDKTEDSEARIENLNEFKSLTLDLEESISNDEVIASKPLTAFDKLSLILSSLTLSSDNKKQKDNAVKLMTIHAAKGLEFPIVFVYGLEEKIFPLGGDDALDNEIKEERRLMYVAITRAKEELFLTNAQIRKIYGDYRVNNPSRFISEIDESLMSLQGVQKAKNVQRKSEGFFEQVAKVKEEIITNNNDNVYNKKAIKAGTKIVHSRFGEGIVIKIDGDIGTIAFNAAHGIKKLDINHPAISVI